MARSKVELFEQIRKAHDREGLSIRALAERFGVHRRTVRQALDCRDRRLRESRRRRGVARRSGRGRRSIDTWLEDDKDAPKKQRHTARRVYERLVEEYGADVGESTVRRYVGTVRAKRRGAAPGSDGSPAPPARRGGRGRLRRVQLLPRAESSSSAGCSSCGCRRRARASTAST